jgi:hypothetical protein
MAPAVMPRIKYLDIKRYKKSMGSMAMESPVKRRLQFVAYWPKKVESPMGRVLRLSLWMNTRGKKKSFQMGTAL